MDKEKKDITQEEPERFSKLLLKRRYNHEPMRGDLRRFFLHPYQTIRFMRNRLYRPMTKPGFGVKQP